MPKKIFSQFFIDPIVTIDGFKIQIYMVRERVSGNVSERLTLMEVDTTNGHYS